MSKIKDIIISGRAPGVRCGESAADPKSVYALAPKAIKEIERGEKRSKRGVDGKDIAKYMGMSVDTLKKVWTKSNSRAFGCLLLFVSLFANGQDINPGTTFVDGQTIHASDLNNLVKNAVIAPTFVGNKPYQVPNFTTARVLFYGSGNLYYCTPYDIVDNYQSISTLAVGLPNLTNGDSTMFYNVSGSALNQVTFTNLISLIGTNINPANANYNLVPTQPSSFSPIATNNSYKLPIWGTNGTLYSITYSNLVYGAFPWIGTNLNIPYVYSQVFTPAAVYAPITNTTWRTNVPFAITGTNMFGTNTLTISTNDTIPLGSTLQGTNTTTSVGALLQLVPTTVYRAGSTNFSGTTITTSFTSSIGTTNYSIMVTPTSPFSGYQWYVSSKTSTNFVLSFASSTTASFTYLAIPYQ